MDISTLSSLFSVRRLNHDDLECIYSLSLGNPLFFKHCPPFVTRQSILDDMHILPPNMSHESKYYVGFFEHDKLIALLDLVLGYPSYKTAFIGLFMMSCERQGHGLGTQIIGECAAALKAAGYTTLRLGYAKGNPQSESFWIKNRFQKTGEEYQRDSYIAVMMEKQL